MTLRFIDSFDHYASADLTMKWSSTSGTAPTIASVGRRSTSGLRFGAGSSSVIKTLDPHATWTVGFAVNVSTAPLVATRLVVAFDTGTEHLRLRLNTDGTISVLRGGSTVLSTSAAALAFGGYSFVEWTFTINDTTGSYDVRINGSSVTSGTGVDTRNGANSTVNQIQLRSVSDAPGGTWDFDDVYMCDGAGSTNNTFLGDVRVDCYMPNGNGNSSQLTGSDGNSTDNYALVDESSQNGDTDYVQSATVNQKDTYAMVDMSHTPTSIFGTQLNMIAKKDDSGTRSICSVVRSGGTDYDGDTQALSTSYQDYRQIRETDPATSAAWTRTNLNNAEFGVKVAA